ncbi:MAG: class I SAM-dependent methyltransferase, partial [Anaerolineaceae bacterium]|nr:class I SAM-dependent methyltransferase [Anaerolineaceae bacterium]
MEQPTLTFIWEKLHQEGYTALADLQPGTALEAFYLACISFAQADFSRAVDVIQTALVLDPTSLVFPAAEDYLRRVACEGKEHVYTDPRAFGAFIRGGGNLPLYSAVSAALRETYLGYTQFDLLDIGSG